MVRLAEAFRWLALAIFTIAIAPILTEGTKRLAEYFRLYDRTTEAVSLVVQWPWLTQAALIAGGLTIGAWMDWLLRKLNARGDRTKRSLGRKMAILAKLISEDQKEFPGKIAARIPSVMSVFIELEKFGIWTPDKAIMDLDDEQGQLVMYLRFVGTMLADGHFENAKATAQQAKVCIEDDLRRRDAQRP